MKIIDNWFKIDGLQDSSETLLASPIELFNSLQTIQIFSEKLALFCQIGKQLDEIVQTQYELSGGQTNLSIL